ncbi:hypothetical protein CDL15_Pgr004664 [Punica granatum]|uniref:Uncharacterized protein n=1 Tax=Punica granatum TaxID=22663 RepID=A0A218WR61_PUNGR|nr:hypothetical protein CDL15_Pgr004664 [Punica granatum]
MDSGPSNRTERSAWTEVEAQSAWIRSWTLGGLRSRHSQLGRKSVEARNTLSESRNYGLTLIGDLGG